MAIALPKIPKKQKTGNRGIVGLDLDGEFIAAVQTSADGISRAVSEELAPGVITDGEVTDVPALADQLREFFKKHSLPRRGAAPRGDRPERLRPGPHARRRVA